MRGKKNPPLDLTPPPAGTPVTFDTMATAYLEDYVLQRYRTMNTARPRVEHLRGCFGGWAVEAITAEAVRQYQLARRRQAAEAATINRETSALSRMFQLAIRRGLLARRGRRAAARLRPPHARRPRPASLFLRIVNIHFTSARIRANV